MKKAKFNDNFSLIAGSCIGHYQQFGKQCKQCRLVQLCKQRLQKQIFPQSEQQVKSIINRFLNSE